MDVGNLDTRSLFQGHSLFSYDEENNSLFQERRARPFPSRVAGHAQRCGQYGASREGIRSQGDEGGGGRARPESSRPACKRCRESGGRVSACSGELPTHCRRGKSIAFDSVGEEGARRGGGSRPFGRSRGPLSGTERGPGRRTHYAAPTRPPVCVSGSRSRPTGGLGRVGSGVGAVPRVAGSGRWGSVGSSAWRRRPLPGPVLLCQPCGGHPLLVRKSSVSYPSECCVNAWYGAPSAA